MKSLILATALLSVSAYAHHNQSLETIKRPTVPGTHIRFSATASSPEGICKVLGFETGIPGSALKSSVFGYTVIADSNGEITSYDSSSYYVKSVTCSNYTGMTTYRDAKHISSPVAPGTSTRYSFTSSSANGVCRSLGFEFGLGITRSSVFGSSLIADGNGDITGMNKSSYYVKGATCANKSFFGGTVPHPEPIPSLGYSFRDRAYQIADTVFKVAKTIEPYLNNDEERVIDELKKQAQRLKSRIEGQRKHTVVRNTLYTLESQLSSASIFIDRYLETDHLDGLAAQLMTARESILGMVEYLDDEYDGKAALY